MAKAYKITFKTYYNDRLHMVDFHGEHTYPLYIQVTYRRKTVIFKSYFFDLLAKQRYKIGSGSRIKHPKLHDVINRETAVLNFISRDLPSGLTIEAFKARYELYSLDLCTLTEADFRLYMFMFFKQKKLSTLARVLSSSKTDYVLYDLLNDLSSSMEAGLYKALLEGAVSGGKFAAPYLQLYEFVRENRPAHLNLLSLFEWADVTIQEDLLSYLSTRYSEPDSKQILEMIRLRVKYLIKQRD